MDKRSATSLLFDDLFDKHTEVTFDEPHTSSDGGAILLKAVDKKLDLTSAFTGAIDDPRQEGKVTHPLEDLVGQRIFGLACGYSDCNPPKADQIVR